VTFLIIFGGVAAAYIAWLLVRFVALALPLGAGIASTLAMLDQGAGHGIAIGGGIAVAAAIHVAGQQLFAKARSPLLRTVLLIFFASPAGIAGFHGAASIGRMAFGDGWVLDLLSVGAAAVAAIGACRHLRAMSSRRVDAGLQEPGASRLL
jgi:hypothetical protein